MVEICIQSLSSFFASAVAEILPSHLSAASISGTGILFVPLWSLRVTGTEIGPLILSIKAEVARDMVG